MRLPNRIALITGVALTAATAVAIAVGSTGLRHFDPALTGYAIGSLIAAFAVGYRFSVWAQRPPSRMYFRRGLELFFRRADTPPSAQTPEPVPEPGEWAFAGMATTGVLGLIARARRRRAVLPTETVVPAGSI